MLQRPIFNFTIFVYLIKVSFRWHSTQLSPNIVETVFLGQGVHITDLVMFAYCPAIYIGYSCVCAKGLAATGL